MSTRDAILSFLSSSSSSSATPADIAATCGSTATAVRCCLHRLRVEGSVEPAGKRGTATLWALVREPAANPTPRKRTAREDRRVALALLGMMARTAANPSRSALDPDKGPRENARELERLGRAVARMPRPRRPWGKRIAARVATLAGSFLASVATLGGLF